MWAVNCACECNNAFRIRIWIGSWHWRCSASGIFAKAHIDDFYHNTQEDRLHELPAARRHQQSPERVFRSVGYPSAAPLGEDPPQLAVLI